MSHQEYIDKCDEGQLECLIEMAEKKIAAIRASGYVKLYVVGDDFSNDAWFDNYADAAEEFANYAKRLANRTGGEHVSITAKLDVQKYRPDEAAELVKETKARKP